jgi:hypothetical protein
MFSLVNLRLKIGTSAIAIVYASLTDHFIELIDCRGSVTFRITVRRLQILIRFICICCIIQYIFVPIIVIIEL